MNRLEFIQPNFNHEWEEASRMDKLGKAAYPELYNLGKDGWVETAKKGHTKNYNDIKDVLGNVDLRFDNLEEPKKERFKQALINGVIEMPIAVKFSDNDYDLVAGNTRISGLVNNKITKFQIWVVDISHLIENMINENKLKGGKADKMSKKDIADKFNVALSKIDHELDMGKKIEMEHVNSTAKAKEIAMDHLVEIPDYYTRLKKMEKEGERKWAKKNMNESVKDYFIRVLKEDVELKLPEGTVSSITTDYDIIYNKHKAGVLTLSSHNKSIEPIKDGTAIELVIIQIEKDYQGKKIGKEVIKNIWAVNPDINRIYLMPTSQSRGFWKKMGALRYNDTYHVITKGHPSL